MTNKSFPPATVIPADFFIHRPVAVTADGFNIYPSFAPKPLTREQVIARVQLELEATDIDSVQHKALTETLERLTGHYTPRPTVDVEALADWLIELATDQVEDQFGNPVDVSDILALFDGAVESDVVDAFSRRLIGTSIDRTPAAWVPNADLNNAHNVDAFERAFNVGATDWSGANVDGLPVDVDGRYDVDNAGFFDKFQTSESLGFSECTESFFSHTDCGESDWA